MGSGGIRMRAGLTSMLPATALTRHAVRVMTLIILGTALFLVARYGSLPDLLPVHFAPKGMANGWQYKTVGRVLMPAFVQLALLVTLGGIGALLLSRTDRDRVPNGPDITAAATATEAVMLIALIWVAFQAYTAFALVRMWTVGQSGLGSIYSLFELIGLALTVVVGVRAHVRLGRPAPLAYVPEHWRFGQLYCNRDHPALFVPTRDGSRWTLNFGRPATVVLLGIIIAMGVVLPVLILALALRS
jgi:uncharacterized membrane protein